MRRGRGRTHARRGPRITTSVAAAILAAGGGGRRARSREPKQFRRLAGRPLFEWAVDALLRAGCRPVILVFPEDLVARARSLVEGREELLFAAGGRSRQESVANGLMLVETEVVVVHDAARPFVTPALVEKVRARLGDVVGAVAATPVGDTLKRASVEAVHEPVVTDTVARAGLWAAQTPQAFYTDALRKAHRGAAEEGFVATDDAELIERFGGRVAIVEGSSTNIKLTYPEDFEIAEAIASRLRR